MIGRSVSVLLLCSAAAHAAEFQPLIDRPITLPQGKIDFTLHGTYTDWHNGLFGLTQALDGETLALGVDYGAADRIQLGVGLAVPIHPGASFGSVLVSGLFSADPRLAVRVDAGYERVGINGGGGTIRQDHGNRYFGGLGAAIKVPITGAVAFVSGRNDAVSFGQFANVGSNAGFYFGATGVTQTSSDFLVISGYDQANSETAVGINVPAGLLVQPDPHIAMTLRAGYSAVIWSSTGPTGTLHFIPLALEAVVSPLPALDIGARFSLDGYVGASDDRLSLRAGYFDMLALMVWFRFRA